MSIHEQEQEDIARPEPGGPGPAGKKWVIAFSGLVCVFVVLAGYELVSNWAALDGGPAASSTGSPAGARPAAGATPKTRISAASPSSSPASARQHPVRALSIVSAAAFGPEGTSDGDNTVIVSRVLDGGGTQAWYSRWYTTPEFGGLQSGTGILLDMGKTVTVSRARLVLGDPAGADVQLRVGDVAALADLSEVAGASDAGGAVDLRLPSPAKGRYVLIWFTRLPPDAQGTYQVSVYSAAVDGVGTT